MSPSFVAILLVSISAVSYSNACGAWRQATMTAYDDLDGSWSGAFVDYTGVSTNFLNAVSVAAVHQKNWGGDKYHNIEIKRSNGQTFTVQSWDECADADCNGCCTKNANAHGGYLLDVEKRTLQRNGVANWDQTFEGVTFRICDAFDPAPIAKQYGLKH